MAILVPGYRLTHAMRRLTSMSGADRFVALRASVGLPAAALVLRVIPYQRFKELLGGSPRPTRDRQPEEVSAIVEAVARRHPYRANCLERSLTLWWILRRNGVASEIRFGVRPPKGDGSPDFHAWVEVDGAVVNDRPDICEEFLPFEGPYPRGRLV